MTVSQLFDPDESGRRKREAMQRVDRAAHEAWKRKAYDCILYCARTMAEFTTDATAALMARHYPDLKTHEPKAWGPLMTMAGREGWIAVTDRYAESAMVSNHQRPKRVWRSLA